MTGLAGQSNKRIEAIRWLRGVAALLVVLSHLMSVERKYAGDRLLPDWLISGFTGVDLFFGISGFVMVWVTWQTVPGMRSAARFLWSRITRIYPVYWLVTLALLPVWLKMPQIVFASAAREPILWRSFLLFPDYRDPLLPVGWTLIHEMYFYIVFTLILFLKPAWRLYGVLAWISLVMVLAWQYWPMQHVAPVMRIAASPLALEFLAGALAAWCYLRWKGQIALLALIAGAALFLGGLVLLMWAEGPQGFGGPWRGFLFAPGLLLLMYGLVGMEARGHQFDRFLCWVGDQSYSLYLTHLLTLSVLGRIWASFAMPGAWDNIIALPALLAGSLLVGWLCYALVERPLVRWSHQLRQRLFPKPA